MRTELQDVQELELIRQRRGLEAKPGGEGDRKLRLQQLFPIRHHPSVFIPQPDSPRLTGSLPKLEETVFVPRHQPALHHDLLRDHQRLLQIDGSIRATEQQCVRHLTQVFFEL